MNKLISILIACLIFPAISDAQVVKIACVGNSITYEAGILNRDKMSYPAQLQAWLGSKYNVRNFGVSGATLLRKGDKPYWNEPEYQQVLTFEPDIIIIKIGTNDSKPQNWKYAGEFEKDYTDMVLSFMALSSKPRILLAFPVPVFVPEKWAFPDDVHPNSIGASVMVEQIYRSLFHRDKAHSSGYINTATLPVPGAECRGTDAGWGGEGRTVWAAVPEIWDSLFKPLNAANFGISGDRTQHLLWRIQNGNFDKIKPKVIPLEIGVNNFADNTANEVAGAIKSIVRALQKKVPGVKILLFGPLPTGNDNLEPNRVKYKLIHGTIKGLDNGKTILYQNMDQLFFNPDGTLVPGLLAGDGIHLTAAGYRQWAGVIIPAAKKLMRR